MIEKTYPFAEKLIHDGLILAEQLNQQLHQEADSLKKTQHAEAIAAIAAKKKQLVAGLEQFNVQLSRVLASENLPNSQQGLTDYFQRAQAANLSTEATVKNWATLRLLCSESKTLNEQNGAGIELLTRHSRHSLHILKGKPQLTCTYGPDGTSKSVSYTRTLVMA